MGADELKRMVNAPMRAISQTIGRGGQPLPAPVQHYWETKMAANFSDVRVHEGQEAAHVGARAFTQGNDIFFRSGEFQPHDPGGQKLLANELTHVVQQAATRVTVPKGMVEVSEPSQSSEEPGGE